MTSDRLLGRNVLKDEATNALLHGAGHNLRKILARIAASTAQPAFTTTAAGHRFPSRSSRGRSGAGPHAVTPMPIEAWAMKIGTCQGSPTQIWPPGTLPLGRRAIVSIVRFAASDEQA